MLKAVQWEMPGPLSEAPTGVLTEYQRVRTTQSEGNSCRAGAEAGGPPAGVSGPGPRWPRRLQVLAVEVAGGRQVWLVF